LRQASEGLVELGGEKSLTSGVFKEGDIAQRGTLVLMKHGIPDYLNGASFIASLQ
jgi:hypothetical protein